MKNNLFYIDESTKFTKDAMKKAKKIMENHIYNNELDILKKMCLYWMDEYTKLQKKYDKLKDK